MPRLSALLLTLAALSANFAPVLSLGVFEICQDRLQQRYCLTALGAGQEIRMRKRDGSQQQLWRLTTETNPNPKRYPVMTTAHNDFYGCKFHKNRKAVLTCDMVPDKFVRTSRVFMGTGIPRRSIQIELVDGPRAYSMLYYLNTGPNATVEFVDDSLQGPPVDWNVTEVAKKDNA